MYRALVQSGDGSDDNDEDNAQDMEETQVRRTKRDKPNQETVQEAEASRAELELLLADDMGTDNNLKGYNLKPKTGKGKKGKEIPDEGKIPDVDYDDPRFSSLFTSPLFAQDPTDPQFKRRKEWWMRICMHVLSTNGSILFEPLAKTWPHKPPRCSVLKAEVTISLQRLTFEKARKEDGEIGKIKFMKKIVSSNNSSVEELARSVVEKKVVLNIIESFSEVLCYMITHDQNASKVDHASKDGVRAAIHCPTRQVQNQVMLRLNSIVELEKSNVLLISPTGSDMWFLA
ncbi:Uncharacterized protein Fot_08069 [Forsythia ovata]|uniref:NUC153 domain-containing protein n=1 Tax=Forsythia ovata TaxID=205694 RepID=A0ABD1X1Q2_9LAMI